MISIIHLFKHLKPMDIMKTTSATDRLFQAVKESNNPKLIKSLISDENANFDAIDEKGNTPLYYAVIYQHIVNIKTLLIYGSDTKIIYEKGQSILHVACKLGDPEIVEMLIEKAGVDVNSVDLDGNTALHIACEKENLEIVTSLVKHGASIDPVNEDFYRPLSIACINGNLKIIKFLVKNNADIEYYLDHQNNEDNLATSPLLAACENGHLEVVEFLLQSGANIAITTSIEDGIGLGYNAFNLAPNLEMAELLFNKSFNIETINHSGDSTLHEACYRGNIEIVEFLLKKGVNKDLTDGEGSTALMIAANKGFVDIVEVLIAAEVNKEVTGYYREYTALMLAAKEGHTDIVKILIAAKANKEVRDSYKGYTALMLAATNGFADIVEILLADGSNRDAVGINGNTALMLAAKNGFADIVKILTAAGSDVKAVNHHGCTAFMIAATSTNSNCATIKMLKEVGSDVNALNPQGYTALMMAVKTPYRYNLPKTTEIFKALIAAGSDIEGKTSEGNTALSLIFSSTNLNLPSIEENIKIIIIKELIKAGANIEAVNNAGRTVLQLHPQYFNRDFLVPIFKEAIDEGNTKALANLCKYPHYRAELSRLDVEDIVQMSSNMNNINNMNELRAFKLLHDSIFAFRDFLSEYESINPIIDKELGLKHIIGKKYSIVSYAAYSANKIVNFFTADKSRVCIKTFNMPENALDLIASYTGWQKKWKPASEIEELFQEKHIEDIKNASGLEISIVTNKNLDALKEVFQFSESTKQEILNKLPLAMVEAFQKHPEAQKLFTKDINKAMQFMWLKLIAKTLSYNIDYYSDDESIIHFRGGQDIIANYRIYETSKGELLISKVINIVKTPNAIANEYENENSDLKPLAGSKRSSDVAGNEDERDTKAQKPAFDDEDEVNAAEESKDDNGYIVYASFGQFSNKNSLVHDDFSSNNLPLPLKIFNAIMPKVSIEYTSSSVKKDTPKIKSAQESEPSNKMSSYDNMAYKAILGLKILDSSADGLKAVHEPSFENLNVAMRGYIHLGVMITGTSGYLTLVSAVDIAEQLYYGKITQAFIEAGTTAGYTLLSALPAILPGALGVPLAPIYQALAITYITEQTNKVFNKFSSLYSTYGTPEANLKSNLAYAELNNYLGFQGMAKNYFINAMQVVKEDFELHHNYESSIQLIADEHKLMGSLCKLNNVDYDYCNA